VRTVSISPAGPVTFCGSGTLTATASGGSACTSIASYQWYRGGVAISGATASTYAASVSGSYTVTVTDSAGATSAPSAPVSVTVNAVPAAPTAGSNSPRCVGQTLNLTASTVSGATYAWTGPNGFTSSAQNPSIVNVKTAAAGTYSVRVTVNGCQSSAGTTAVSVTADPTPPTVTAPAAVVVIQSRCQ
jgi:hypothetical protein